MLRVGLTGGISSGKSTAGSILRQLGAEVFDADEIVAGLYARAQPGSAAVAELFGPEYLENGAVNKTLLSRRVFDDFTARQRLESKIHPLVTAEITHRFAAAAQKGVRVAVAEASQIFEGGYEKEFDRILLIVSPEVLRLKRWRERGLAPRELERRMAAQIVENEARKKANDVVVNAGTVEELRAKLQALYGAYLRSAESEPGK